MLVIFKKKEVNAGETEVFRLKIDPLRDLGFLNRKGEKYLDKGEYRIMAGDQSISAYVK